MRYGLVGEKLSHSFSKEIHESIAPYSYDLFSLNRQELDAFFTKKEFAAVNVTIPYKQDVMAYLDEIDPRARRIGAVNTVVNRNGRLTGYNTDYDGVVSLLRYADIDVAGKKVLVLGTGGTCKTVCAVLGDLGAGQITVVSRSPKIGQISYDEAAQRTDTQIIINTTPAGMYPNNCACPIDLTPFDRLCGVVDVIYNPLRTNLILAAREKGIPAVGGLYMLVAQAVYASAHFLNREPEPEQINTVYQSLLAQKQNIVLIGMPGCGKTTIGALLSQKTGKTLVDIDAEIVSQEGVSIPDIFAAAGEGGFRDIETRVTAQFAARSGQVISTGGGVILRRENMTALKQNGVVIFLDRPLKDLTPGGGRPLSSNRQDLEKRYNERYELYKKLSDIQIVNDVSPENGLNRVMEALHETACD